MAHFPGTGANNKIHTTRGGTCTKGSCGYRANTSPPLAFSPWQAHHILCFYSVNAYGASTFSAEIDACYKMTDWCLNQSPNMIALPMKSVYRKNHAVPGCLSLNLPCHNIDHNCDEGYTDEVTDAIDAKIWKKMEKAAQKAVDGKTHFTPEDIQSDLKDLETKFRAKLKARGLRGGGTQKAFNNIGKTSDWWLAFSMAKKSVAMATPRMSL